MSGRMAARAYRLQLAGLVRLAVLVLVLDAGSSPVAAQLNRAPQFLPAGDMARFSLPEDAPVGAPVYRLQGVDPEGSQVRYSISGEHFTVDRSTGVVSLRKQLDRETQDLLEVIISITDEGVAGSDPNTVSLRREIPVLDVNDNAPVFKNRPYAFTVSEATKVGARLFDKVVVTDADGGLNADITLSCVPSGPEDSSCKHFRIETEKMGEGQYVGIVSLARPLDYEQRSAYSLQLRATDGAADRSKRMHSMAHIAVQILDVQDQPPLFMNAPYSATVPEGSLPGTVVAVIRARDGDMGDPRPVRLTIEGDDLGYFSLQHEDSPGDVVEAKLVTSRIPLDREHRDVMHSGGIYTFQIRATELINNELPGDWSVSEVTVVVTDVDDQIPEFNEDYFHINVSEDIAPDSPLPGLNMVVVDGDVGDNARYALSLRDVSNSEGLFSVHPTSGMGRTPVVVRLRSLKGLDFDVADPAKRRIEFDVVVHARGETGDEEEFGSARVVVDVLDANDHSPVFPQAMYRARVSELASPGTKVLDVSATDADSGDFGLVSYMLKGFGAERFRTHPQRGGVYVLQGLDYETEKSYSLSLEARDGGGRVTTVNVFVDVVDENDNAPVFEQQEYQRTVREGATSFQPSMFLRATDEDGPNQGGGKLFFSVTSSNSEDDILFVEPVSGEVKMNRAVSAADTPRGQYELTVRATDAGKPPLFAEAHVTVRVGVPGNQRPVFRSQNGPQPGSGSGALYRASVPENVKPNTTVLQVAASDPDGQDSLILYSIAAGAKDNFNIDSKSGVITVTPEARLDPDETGVSRYELVVLAVDNGLPVRETASATVAVTIEDVNNKAPSFDASDPSTLTRHVSERAQPGQTITFVKAKDPDADAKLEYSIIEPIRAVDRTGVPLATGGSSSSYNYRNAFRINSTTGELVVNGPLDHQAAAVISLTVQAKDLNAKENVDKQVARADVTIYVQEYSDGNPLFTVGGWTPSNQVIKISVPEEQSRGTLLLMLSAVDPLAGGRAVRRFLTVPDADGSTPDWAALGLQSGNLVLDRRLDFETLPSKTLSLRVHAVSEDLKRTSQATVEVQVQDVNDHSPQFAQPSYHTSVRESTRYPTNILVVSATDGDAPSTVTDQRGFGDIRYSLTGENAGSFHIDPISGTIQVAPNATLDRERQMQMKLTVVAADTPLGGANQRKSSVPVTVDILDVNDNAPQFTKRSYSSVIAENVPVGSSVLHMSATDPDEGEGGEVTYELLDQGDANGLFAIDPSSGLLRTSSRLTGKGRGEPYTLRVRAQDGGDPALSSGMAVSIYIADVVSNDGVPQFVHPALDEVAYVSENASIGSPVFRVLATDPDDPRTAEGMLVYKFLDDGKVGTDAVNFNINALSGLITTRAPLDRERKAQYSLLLVAADKGTVPQQTTRLLTVHVTDVDDHKPVFKRSVDESPLAMTVQEEVPVGTEVGRLTAEDEDVGENALIDYVITYGNEHDLFSVSRTDDNGAVIKVTRRLDREEEAEHLITVKCFKKSARPQSLRKTYNRQDPSERQVRITVIDIDDNPPTFTKDNMTLGVRLNVPVDTSLLTLEAVDKDSDSAPLRYWLSNTTFYPLAPSLMDTTPTQGAMVDSVFRLDNETGELRTASSMAQFADGYFTLRVSAANSPRAEMQINTTVKVFVVRDRALLKFVFGRPPAEVRRLLPEFQRQVEKALLLPAQLNVYDTQFLAKNDGSLDFSSTSSCFQLVGRENYDLSDMESLLRDRNNDELNSVYNKYQVRAVQRCAPASAKAEASWTQLWVLAIACFIGIASLIASCVVCCSYNRWERLR